MNETEESRNRFEWLYFLRQLLVNSGAWSCFFMMGLSMGSSTVVVPQLRKEANSTEAVSVEMASWLPTITIYAGIPWVIVLPILTAKVGRKMSHLIVSASGMISFIVFYCSKDITQILIAQAFQGPVAASHFTVEILIISEYSSSEHRGFFLTLKSATSFWGLLAANLLGTFWNWRNIPLVGIMCAIYSLATVFIWPESPFWLAEKGRFEQCTKAHRWLKGSQMASEKELQALLASQQSNTKISFRAQITKTIKLFVTKKFYKPILISVLLLALHALSGKLVCTVYAIDILKNITNNESAAYTGMLILDAVTVSIMYIGCVLAKSFKRRTMLLTASSVSILFMLSISLYLYLIKFAIISENRYLSLSLLVGYSAAISCGPLILSQPICGEIISLESRSLSTCILALCFKIINGTVIKTSPFYFKQLGMHGTFLLFGLCSIFCLVLVYIYVPETKDKTLQEIYDDIKGVKPSDEAKELLPVVRNNVTIVSNSNKIE